MRIKSCACALLLGATVTYGLLALAQSKNLAPGFTVLPPGAKVVVMPTDIELFSISAGGVHEPKADWTESASKHFRAAMLDGKRWRGLTTVELNDKDADELAEINTLHAAVARAIAVHHFGTLPLPTKDGKLDWSMGASAGMVKKISGADYALFSWVRDSYASGERAAAMVAIAVLTLGRAVPQGGSQVGFASLVDLNTGRVVWFNRLARGSGDLRQPEQAPETLDALLDKFPTPQ